MSGAQFISIHSYRGGTGKSNITANLGVLLAARGLNVGLVDMDIQSPGIHALFGFDVSSFKHCLNDYLWSRCTVEDAVYDLCGRLEKPVEGRLMLLPSSIHPGDIARIIHDGYDVDRLNDGLAAFTESLALDVLLIDTHPGLGEETLLSLALSDRLLVLLRPDQQDYQGTSVTLKVAAQLSVPKISLCINKAPGSLPEDSLRQKIVEAYGHPVDAVFYHSEEMMVLGSGGIFAQRHPGHDFTRQLDDLAGKLVS
ncbi:MAG TPA: MinD/ParA family protein [Candidatus Sumerlaeota bacterium]|nr:MinD/ParA family protein [Candidatus Sumerlaeota bacterium]